MRKVTLNVFYNDVSIGEDITPFLLNFSYTDRTSNSQADDMSITLQDVVGLWKNGWFPSHGAKFSASLFCEDWLANGESCSRDCGIFEIDQLSFSGMPSTVTISAISTGSTNAIRRQLNTNKWDNMNLKDLVRELANKSGFNLDFDNPSDDHKWWLSEKELIPKRWEQKEESDISTITRFCEDEDLMVKIRNKNIFIFDRSAFDEHKVDVLIDIRSDRVLSYDFSSSSSDVYKGVEIESFDSETKITKTFKFVPDTVSGLRTLSTDEGSNSQVLTLINASSAGAMIDQEIDLILPDAETKPDLPDPAVGQMLKINEYVASEIEAMNLAMSALSDLNRRQLTGSISLVGRPDIYSGQNANIFGFGRLDTVVWHIEEIKHNYFGSGYTSELKLRGVLSYETPAD